MTYEMFFEAVKSHLKRYYFEDLPDYKLVEYMKSQEDVIQDQYDYWNWQVDENKEEAPVVEEVKEVDEVPSEDDNHDQEDDKLFDTMSNIDVSDLFKIDTEEDKEEDNEDSVLDDKKDSLDDTISALFASEETQPIDFKKLNDSINEEYESIFGNSDDIDITEDKDLFITGEETNSFDINSLNDEPSKEEEVQEKSATTDDTIADIFGTKFKPGYDKGSSNDDIVNNFFMTNKLDFNKFTVDEQEYLKKVFSPIAFAKILDILRKNDIDINKVYDNIKLFEMGTTELEGIINKLLISGQSKANISLVLNVLPMIRLTDLNEVLESFGPDAAKADITDILIVTGIEHCGTIISQCGDGSEFNCKLT